VDEWHHERHVSLDIDLRRLREIASEAGIEIGATLPVPIGFESKGLHVDLDIRDASGNALSLLPSFEDAIASYAIAKEWLDNARLNLPEPEVSEILEHLLVIARHHFTREDEELLWRYLEEDDGSPLPVWVESEVLGKRALSVVEDLLGADNSFIDLLVDLSARCRPLVAVPTSGDVFILKVRRVEVGRLPDMDLRSRLRLAPASLQLEDSTLGRARSSHLRVVAPEGTELASVVVQSPTWFEKYRVRLTARRAMIHATADEFQVDRRFILVEMRPAAKGFVWSSLSTCLISTLTLLMLIHLERIYDGYVTTFASDNTEVVIAILLALPSVYVLFLSRQNEHDLRSYMLRDLRGCLYVVGAASTAAMLALVVSGRFGDFLLPVWLVAVAVSGGCSLLLVAGIGGDPYSDTVRDTSTYVSDAFTVQLELELDSAIDTY
jgi:hypothetical protein